MAGDADKELEVIASVSSEQTAQMKEFMEQVPITVEHIDNGITFDIVITLYKGVSYARVRIANYHTNIVLVEKNGEILEKKLVAGESEDGLTDRSLLNMRDILDFARTVDIEDVREVLERQIDYNWAIAEEGIREITEPISEAFFWIWKEKASVSGQRLWRRRGLTPE